MGITDNGKTPQKNISYNKKNLNKAINIQDGSEQKLIRPQVMTENCGIQDVTGC
jgi:hypothetical protein